MNEDLKCLDAVGRLVGRQFRAGTLALKRPFQDASDPEPNAWHPSRFPGELRSAKRSSGTQGKRQFLKRQRPPSLPPQPPNAPPPPAATPTPLPIPEPEPDRKADHDPQASPRPDTSPRHPVSPRHEASTRQAPQPPPDAPPPPERPLFRLPRGGQLPRPTQSTTIPTGMAEEIRIAIFLQGETFPFTHVVVLPTATLWDVRTQLESLRVCCGRLALRQWGFCALQPDEALLRVEEMLLNSQETLAAMAQRNAPLHERRAWHEARGEAITVVSSADEEALCTDDDDVMGPLMDYELMRLEAEARVRQDVVEQAELLRQKRAEHEGGHVVWRLFPRIFTKQVNVVVPRKGKSGRWWAPRVARVSVAEAQAAGYHPPGASPEGDLLPPRPYLGDLAVLRRRRKGGAAYSLAWLEVAFLDAATVRGHQAGQDAAALREAAAAGAEVVGQLLATSPAAREHVLAGQCDLGLNVLYEAVARGDASLAVLLLQSGADPYLADWGGRTPLHLAAAKGLLELVLVATTLHSHATPDDDGLRERWEEGLRMIRLGTPRPLPAVPPPGSPPLHRIVDHAGRTPLHDALHYRHAAVAVHLLKCGGHDLYARDRLTGLSVRQLFARAWPPSVAAAQGSVEWLEVWIDHLGLDLHKPAGLQRFTLMHHAIVGRSAAAVAFLLRRGFNPNMETPRSPLPHLLAKCGSPETFQAFYEHIDLLRLPFLHARNASDETPLHVAIRHQFHEMAARLLNSRYLKLAHLSAVDKQRQNPLHAAAVVGNVDTVVLILARCEGRAEVVCARDILGDPPLGVAIRAGNPDIVATLLACRTVDIDGLCSEGRTPLFLATCLEAIRATFVPNPDDAAMDAHDLYILPSPSGTPLPSRLVTPAVPVSMLTRVAMSPRGSYLPLPDTSDLFPVQVWDSGASSVAIPYHQSRRVLALNAQRPNAERRQRSLPVVLLKAHANLRSGGDPSRWDSPLHQAVRNVDPHLCAQFLAFGADPLLRYKGRSPVGLACDGGQVSLIDVLLTNLDTDLAAPPLLDFLLHEGEGRLCAATAAAVFVLQRTRLNVVRHGYPYLQYACKRGNLELLQHLLDAGCPVTPLPAGSPTGLPALGTGTPKRFDADLRRSASLPALISGKAVPPLRDLLRCAAHTTAPALPPDYRHALLRQAEELGCRMVLQGASPGPEPPRGVSYYDTQRRARYVALALAARQRVLAGLRRARRSHRVEDPAAGPAPPAPVDSPLAIACQCGLWRLARALVETCHADPNTADCRTQRTPLHAAVLAGALPFTQWLVLQADCDLHARDSRGFTPLMYSVKLADVQLTALLLVAGGLGYDTPRSTPLFRWSLVRGSLLVAADASSDAAPVAEVPPNMAAHSRRLRSLSLALLAFSRTQSLSEESKRPVTGWFGKRKPPRGQASREDRPYVGFRAPRGQRCLFGPTDGSDSLLEAEDLGPAIRVSGISPGGLLPASPPKKDKTAEVSARRLCATLVQYCHEIDAFLLPDAYTQDDPDVSLPLPLAAQGQAPPLEDCLRKPSPGSPTHAALPAKLHGKHAALVSPPATLLASTYLVLHHAVARGDEAAARVLIDAGCEVNYRAPVPRRGKSRTSVAWSPTSLLSASAKAKADANHHGDLPFPPADCLFPPGATPLYLASMGGHLPLVHLLVSKRAAVDVPAVTGETPFGVALRYGHREVALYLLRGGAQPNVAAAQHGGVPLPYALLGGRALLHAHVAGATPLVAFLGHVETEADVEFVKELRRLGCRFYAPEYPLTMTDFSHRPTAPAAPRPASSPPLLGGSVSLPAAAALPRLPRAASAAPPAPAPPGGAAPFHAALVHPLHVLLAAPVGVPDLLQDVAQYHVRCGLVPWPGRYGGRQRADVWAVRGSVAELVLDDLQRAAKGKRVGPGRLDVRLRDLLGRTPLEWAVRRGLFSLAVRLASLGADLLVPFSHLNASPVYHDWWGRLRKPAEESPEKSVAPAGRNKRRQRLLHWVQRRAAGPSRLATSLDGWLPLHAVLLTSPGLSALALVLANVAGDAAQLLSAIDTMGRNAVHVAVLADQPEALRQLLAGCPTGAEPHLAGDRRGRTPLMLAARHRRLDCARLLLQHHPAEQVVLRDDCGATAAHHAAMAGCVPIAELLLEAGARLSDRMAIPCFKAAAPRTLSPTVFLTALLAGQEAFALALMPRMAADDVIPETQETALHLAAYRGLTQVLQRLLKACYPGHCAQRSVFGDTALDVAMSFHHWDSDPVQVLHTYDDQPLVPRKDGYFHGFRSYAKERLYHQAVLYHYGGWSAVKRHFLRPPLAPEDPDHTVKAIRLACLGKDTALLRLLRQAEKDGRRMHISGLPSVPDFLRSLQEMPHRTTVPPTGSSTDDPEKLFVKALWMLLFPLGPVEAIAVGCLEKHWPGTATVTWQTDDAAERVIRAHSGVIRLPGSPNPLTLEYAKRRGPNYLATQPRQPSLVHHACMHNCVESVRYVIAFHTDPDTRILKRPVYDLLCHRDRAGLTPSHVACARGHVRLVVELLKAGLDFAMTDYAGVRPLQYLTPWRMAQLQEAYPPAAERRVLLMQHYDLRRSAVGLGIPCRKPWWTGLASSGVDSPSGPSAPAQWGFLPGDVRALLWIHAVQGYDEPGRLATSPIAHRLLALSSATLHTSATQQLRALVAAVADRLRQTFPALPPQSAAIPPPDDATSAYFEPELDARRLCEWALWHLEHQLVVDVHLEAIDHLSPVDRVLHLLYCHHGLGGGVVGRMLLEALELLACESGRYGQCCLLRIAAIHLVFCTNPGDVACDIEPAGAGRLAVRLQLCPFPNRVEGPAPRPALDAYFALGAVRHYGHLQSAWQHLRRRLRALGHASPVLYVEHDGVAAVQNLVAATFQEAAQLCQHPAGEAPKPADPQADCPTPSASPTPTAATATKPPQGAAPAPEAETAADALRRVHADPTGRSLPDVLRALNRLLNVPVGPPATPERRATRSNLGVPESPAFALVPRGYPLSGPLHIMCRIHRQRSTNHAPIDWGRPAKKRTGALLLSIGADSAKVEAAWVHPAGVHWPVVRSLWGLRLPRQPPWRPPPRPTPCSGSAPPLTPPPPGVGGAVRQYLAALQRVQDLYRTVAHQRSEAGLKPLELSGKPRHAMADTALDHLGGWVFDVRQLGVLRRLNRACYLHYASRYPDLVAGYVAWGREWLGLEEGTAAWHSAEQWAEAALPDTVRVAANLEREGRKFELVAATAQYSQPGSLGPAADA